MIVVAEAEGAGRELQVKITRMRTKSDSSSYWLGSFAGNDWIAVSVDVVNGGKSEKRFTREFVTNKSGVFNAERAKRIPLMIDALAEMIIAEL